ncbi:MAG: hypothetical protein R3F33_10625 [Planctomycetota bacterium]
MKALLSLATLLLAGQPQSLQFRAQPELELRRSLHERQELKLTDIRMVVEQGEHSEDVSPGAFAEMEMVLESQAEWTDRFEAVHEGQPRQVQRSFDRVQARRTQSGGRGTRPGNPHEHDRERYSPLVGQNVRFTWKEEEGEWRTAYVLKEGQAEPDRAWLKELRPEADFQSLLPAEPEGPGQEWELSAQDLYAALYPGGFLGQCDGEENFATAANLHVGFRDGLEGQGTARWKENKDGRAVIEWTAELGTTIAEEPGIPAHATAHFRIERKTRYKLELSGALVWDLERQRARTFHAKGPLGVEIETRNIADEGPVTIRTQVLQGTFEANAEIE